MFSKKPLREGKQLLPIAVQALAQEPLQVQTLVPELGSRQVRVLIQALAQEPELKQVVALVQDQVQVLVPALAQARALVQA